MAQTPTSIAKHPPPTLANAITQIPGSGHSVESSNLGIALTGSMAMGFAVGFMNG